MTSPAEYRRYTTAELAAMPATARFEDRTGDVWRNSIGTKWQRRGKFVQCYDGFTQQPFDLENEGWACVRPCSQLARLLLRRLA